MKKHVLFTFCILFSITFIDAQITQIMETYIQETPPVLNPVQKEGWDLIFSDEFSGSISSGKWRIENQPSHPNTFLDGTWPIRNNGSGAVEFSAEKFETPRQYTYNCGYLGGSWDEMCTSNFLYRVQRIVARQRFSYGYFEIRCKMPRGEGTWPQFWLFDYDDSQPLYNEIDFFENFPNDERAIMITSNAHIDTLNNYGHHEYLGKYLPNEQYYIAERDLSQDFHTYGCEWGENYIKWYFNNKLVREVNTSMGPEIATILRKLTLNQQLIVGMDILEDRVTYRFPSLTSMVVDYIRLYKKKPSLIVNTSQCSATSVNVNAQADGVNSYRWAVTGGSLLSSSGNTARFRLLPGSSSMNISVTATNTAGHSSTQSLTYPSVNPDFQITSIECRSNDIKIRVKSSHPSQNAQSWWGIYHADSDGNITDWNKINPDLFGNEVTFANLGLVNGNDYVIAHGNWNECVDWTVAFKHIKLSISDFTHVPPQCTGGNIVLEANSLHKTSDIRWDLFPGDRFGNITDWTPVTTQWGPRFSFSNVNAGNWYVLSHGVWGDCAGEWTVTMKPVYAPSFPLNPNFKVSISNLGTGNLIARVTAENNYPNSEWNVFESDASGNIGNLVQGPVWSNTATFILPKNKYHLITRGVWNNCSNWQWSGYLIHQSSFPTKPKNQEMISKIAEKVDDITPGIHLFPNPAHDRVTLSIDSEPVDFILNLYSSTGQKVYSIKLKKSNRVEIDLSSYSSGIYFAEVVNKDFRRLEKLIRY